VVETGVRNTPYAKKPQGREWFYKLIRKEKTVRPEQVRKRPTIPQWTIKTRQQGKLRWCTSISRKIRGSPSTVGNSGDSMGAFGGERRKQLLFLSGAGLGPRKGTTKKKKGVKKGWAKRGRETQGSGEGTPSWRKANNFKKNKGSEAKSKKGTVWWTGARKD